MEILKIWIGLELKIEKKIHIPLCYTDIYGPCMRENKRNMDLAGLCHRWCRCYQSLLMALFGVVDLRRPLLHCSLYKTAKEKKTFFLENPIKNYAVLHFWISPLYISNLLEHKHSPLISQRPPASKHHDKHIFLSEI